MNIDNNLILSGKWTGTAWQGGYSHSTAATLAYGNDGSTVTVANFFQLACPVDNLVGKLRMDEPLYLIIKTIDAIATGATFTLIGCATSDLSSSPTTLLTITVAAVAANTIAASVQVPRDALNTYKYIGVTSNVTGETSKKHLIFLDAYGKDMKHFTS